MVLFKDKKKRSKKNKKRIKNTLNYHHNEVLNKFSGDKQKIPELNKKLLLINKSINNYSNKKNKNLTEEELENKLQLIEEQNKIQKEIDNINSNIEKNNYLLNTSHMLFHYFDEDSLYTINHTVQSKKNSKKSVLDFFKKTKSKSTLEINKEKEKNKNKDVRIEFKNKKDILDAYLTMIDKSYIPKLPELSNEELSMCNECYEQRIFDSTHGVMICPTCGCEEKILIDNDTPSYKEPPREITYFAYKKINHANEFLSQFQAKESTDIDNRIFEKIRDELKKERYINIKTISANKVREILKKLELTKYYEHCHYITNRLTGNPAPTLDTELEEKLRNMFKEVQGPWIKYCPSDRANFFSYPYIFYKFFQLLDKDEYLPYCRLLKSREKLQEHDEVWKKICKELRWEFIPTI